MDPWGTERDDMRAACQSIWNRGGSFDAIDYTFPYVKSELDEEETDLQAIAEIEEARRLERQIQTEAMPQDAKT